jgi:hypothetical protein
MKKFDFFSSYTLINRNKRDNISVVRSILMGKLAALAATSKNGVIPLCG